MNRIVVGIVISVLLLTGCTQASTTSKDDTKTETTQTKPEETVKEPKLLLDQKFIPLLASGEIQGFDISIGSIKEDVVKKYGTITKKDFFDGGKYSQLEKLEKGIVYFDGKNRVYAIDLGAIHLDKTNLKEIKTAMGAPKVEEISDIDNEYFLMYESGDVTVYFYAKNKEAPVETIRIINKQMISEAPQNY